MRHKNQQKKGIHVLLAVMLMTGLLSSANVQAVTRGSGYPAQTIMIGDSRAEGMYETVGDSGCVWEYESGMGYNWMTSQGVPEIESMIGNGTSVVIMLGVNDIGDTWMANSYAEYLNAKAAQWKALGANTYYIEVTKCSDGYSDRWGTDNAHIAAWNDSIRQLLSSDVTYVSVGNELGEVGTVDGLHYTSETYQRLFDIVRQHTQTPYAATATTDYAAEYENSEYYGQEQEGFASAPIISEWFTETDNNNSITGSGSADESGRVNGVTGYGTPELTDIVKIDDLATEEQPETQDEDIFVPETPEVLYEEIPTEVNPGVVGTNEPLDASEMMTEEAIQELNDTKDLFETNEELFVEQPVENTGAVPGVVGTNEPIIPQETTDSVAEDVVSEETPELDNPSDISIDTTDSGISDIAEEIETEIPDVSKETENPQKEDEQNHQTESIAEPVLEPIFDDNQESKPEEAETKTETNDDNQEQGNTDDGHLINLDESSDTTLPEQTDESKGEENKGEEDKNKNGSMLAPLRGTAIDSEAIDTTPMQRGWVEEEGLSSYYSDDGTKVQGVEEIDGNLYHFDGHGQLVKNGIYMDNNGITCSDKDGRLVIGWKTEGDNTYLFMNNGYAAIGMVTFEGKRYCFDYDGTLHKGLFIKDGNIYLTNEDGSIASGWIEYQGNTYYCAEDGAVTGPQEIDGKSYLFDANGVLLKGTVNINDTTYELGKEGEIQTGWNKADDAISYVSEGGIKLKGWQKIDGKIYYFGKNGVAAKGSFVKDGKLYMLSEDGSLKNGFTGGVNVRNADEYQTPKEILRNILPYRLEASYPEAYKGDIFDTSKVTLKRIFEDGDTEEVEMFTVGDVSTNPSKFDSDTLITIDSIYGTTSLTITLEKPEEIVEKETEEEVKSGLHVSYNGVVCEGDRFRKSLISVTNVKENGEVENVVDFNVMMENTPIMEETVIPIETDYGKVTLTINPIAIKYVEADVMGIKRPGETINPEAVIFGYSNGTYRRIPISECDFAIAPSSKTLVAGDNLFPLMWKGKEYEMKVVAVKDEAAEQAIAYNNTFTPTIDTGNVGPDKFGQDDLTGLTLESLGTWHLTGYADTPEDQGPYVGQTASGAPLVAGRTVAVSASTMQRRGLNFGDRLVVNGHIYTIEDHGGSAMAGQDWVDIYTGTSAEGGTELEYQDFCNGYAEVYLIKN